MLFTSSVFLFLFLPLTLILVFFSKIFSLKIQNYVLLVLSLIFYAWGELFYVLVLMFTIVIGYYIGNKIAQYRETQQQRAKIYLWLGITILLLLLIYFKHLNFLAENLNLLFNIFKVPTLNLKVIHLPLGLSFFGLQIISYLIDIYKGDLPKNNKLLDVALFVSFFPQLIMGPIVRYIDIYKQINSRTITLAGFMYGVERFTIGFVKKVALADYLAINFVNPVYKLSIAQLDFILAWLGAMFFYIQMYFDFSAYSDMAIGIAAMMGFTFKENFNYPVFSYSIHNFWSRWHISLSSFFGDYISKPLGDYISKPLGGYFRGNLISVRNIFIVFIISGLWHGTGFKFLIWGILWAFVVSIERVFIKFHKYLKNNPVIGGIYVFFVLTFISVFFRSADMLEVSKMLYHMFINPFVFNANIFWLHVPQYVSLFTPQLLITMIFSALICFPFMYQKLLNNKNNKINIIGYMLLFISFLYSISYVIYQNGFTTEFLYMQF